MNSIDQLPPDDLPLRSKLPAMRLSTREALLTWAVAQPGAMPWLLKRGALYWDKLVNLDRKVASRDCDGTAALDLLKWRTQSADDRAAVQHLEALDQHRKFLTADEHG